MEHFNTVRSFFAGDGQRTTQEWIRLQIFRWQVTPGPADDSNEVPASTARLKTRGVRFTLLYQFARSIKSWVWAWDSRFPGWRSGIAGYSILATLVLVANLSALLWVATHLDDDSYYATVMAQNCKSIDNTSDWIHLAMNVLSVALLAGSNYCMQCLSSPTRSEVDAAHARCSYLNVGILSLRNIISFRKRRIFLLLALGLSSIPLHAVYSSSITTLRSSQAYDIAVVSPEFWSGGDFTLFDTPSRHYAPDRQRFEDRLSNLQELTINGRILDHNRWTNLSVAECKKYATIEEDRGSVLLVTEDPSAPRNDGSAAGSEHVHDEMLNGANSSTVFQYAIFPGITASVLNEFSYARKSGHRISYCLSLAVRNHCSLQIHLWLLLSVVVCNIIKLACFILTFKEQQGTPLVTVGDAVASFLNLPCPNVKGMCLLSEDALISALKDDMEDTRDNIGPQARRYKPTSSRCYQSISFVRWTIYATSCALMIWVSSYEWNEIRLKYRGDSIDYSWSALWNMGFGKLRNSSNGVLPTIWCFLPTNTMNEACMESMGFGHILIAAAPQLAVSAIYIAMNYQITVMVQLRDWTRLTSYRQPLRVSDPVPGSVQVSTYWLTLPYRYSIPLFGSSVLLGWLASQALFYYRFVFRDNDGSLFQEHYAHYEPILIDTSPNPLGVYQGLGWSGMGVLLLMIAGVCVFIMSLAFGLQKCTPGLPLGPTSSLVIAAACHPPENDPDAATKLVQWGEVHFDNNGDERDPVRHCTITSRKVKSPKTGRRYA